jgi:putative membrane protein
MYGNDGWGWGAWLGMSFGMLAFTALIVSALVMLVRARTSPDEMAPPPSAEAVLARRLAEGQIDPAEYQERLAALHGSTKAPASS